jgi:hypothetical protein
VNLTTIDLWILRLLRIGPHSWNGWYLKKAAARFILRYQKDHPDWDPEAVLAKARERGEIP